MLLKSVIRFVNKDLSNIQNQVKIDTNLGSFDCPVRLRNLKGGTRSVFDHCVTQPYWLSSTEDE